MLASYNDRAKSVIVEGAVVAKPDGRDAYTNLRVEADKFIITDPADGVTRTGWGLCSSYVVVRALLGDERRSDLAAGGRRNPRCGRRHRRA